MRFALARRIRKNMEKQTVALPWKRALPAGALLLALGLSAQAASTFDLRAKTGGGNAAEYAWDGKVLIVKDGADITITGAVTNGTRIEVAAKATAAITLDDVSISGLKTAWEFGRNVGFLANIGLGPNQSPLTLDAGAKVKLNLLGTNTLTAGDCAEYKDKASYCSGITVPGGATLNIDGTGALTAAGGWGGGGIGHTSGRSIFNGDEGAGGAIVISGGAVTAHAGRSGGAGIGNSDNNITIRGGTVTATGPEDGGGEGIGCNGGGTITISGGTVVAHGSRIGSSGIGGYAGRHGNKDKNLAITLSGGTVSAYGGGQGAGIGGAIIGSDSTINIAITGDANVTAIGGDGDIWSGDSSGGGAGIGAGGNPFTNAVGTIRIDTTGTVKARGGKGLRGGGPGADIGQGGSDRNIMTASMGTGIKSFSDPTPASASAAVGGTASFACNVTPMANAPAPDFTWSWQFYDAAATPPQWTTVRGAISSALTLPRVTPAMAGPYRCVALATNFPDGGMGRAPAGRDAPASSILYASRPATLTVTAKP